MKKSILIALVLALLLLLSGCDAILEMMYPEFGESEQDKDWDTWNAVDVSFWVPWDTQFFYGLIHVDDPFVVEIMDTATGGFDYYDYQTVWMDEWDSFWASFEGMPDGEYGIHVYWDLNGDGVEDWGSEPSWDYFSPFWIGATDPPDHPRWVEIWMDLW